MTMKFVRTRSNETIKTTNCTKMSDSDSDERKHGRDWDDDYNERAYKFHLKQRAAQQKEQEDEDHAAYVKMLQDFAKKAEKEFNDVYEELRQAYEMEDAAEKSAARYKNERDEARAELARYKQQHQQPAAAAAAAPQQAPAKAAPQKAAPQKAAPQKVVAPPPKPAAKREPRGSKSWKESMQSMTPEMYERMQELIQRAQGAAAAGQHQPHARDRKTKEAFKYEDFEHPNNDNPGPGGMHGGFGDDYAKLPVDSDPDREPDDPESVRLRVKNRSNLNAINAAMDAKMKKLREDDAAAREHMKHLKSASAAAADSAMKAGGEEDVVVKKEIVSDSDSDLEATKAVLEKIKALPSCFKESDTPAVPFSEKKPRKPRAKKTTQ